MLLGKSLPVRNTKHVSFSIWSVTCITTAALPTCIKYNQLTNHNTVLIQPVTHRSNVSLLSRATITHFHRYSSKNPKKKPRNRWNQQTDKPYLPYHLQWALKNRISAVYPPFASLRFRSSQNAISTLGNNSLDEGKKARRELISERGCVARIIRRYNMVVRTKGRETERETKREGWRGWKCI